MEKPSAHQLDMAGKRRKPDGSPTPSNKRSKILEALEKIGVEDVVEGGSKEPGNVHPKDDATSHDDSASEPPIHVPRDTDQSNAPHAAAIQVTSADQLYKDVVG